MIETKGLPKVFDEIQPVGRRFSGKLTRLNILSVCKKLFLWHENQESILSLTIDDVSMTPRTKMIAWDDETFNSGFYLFLRRKRGAHGVNIGLNIVVEASSQVVDDYYNWYHITERKLELTLALQK